MTPVAKALAAPWFWRSLIHPRALWVRRSICQTCRGADIAQLKSGSGRTESRRLMATVSSQSHNLQNEEITFASVRVINEDGKQAGIMDPREVLRSMDRSKYTLVCVNQSGEIPVCRIYSTVDMLKKEIEKSKSAAKPRNRIIKDSESKTLVFSWLIAPHDLEHRMRKARDNLTDGYLIEIHIGNVKQSKRKATLEDKQGCIASIRSYLGDIATEWSDMQAKGGITRMYWKVKEQVLKAEQAKESEAEAEDEAASPNKREMKKIQKNEEYEQNQDKIMKKKSKFQARAAEKEKEEIALAQLRRNKNRNRRA